MELIIMLIIATSYSNQRGQTDDTPNVTANNKPVHSCGIAVSRDVEDQGFKIGCRVHIDNIVRRFIRMDYVSYCNGLYVINDRMHWRKRKQVDIFNFDNDLAKKFGVQSGTIKLLWCE